MSKKKWTIWLARRWFSATKTGGGRTSSLLASIGIAVGVAALVVVMGVMNGFQLGYINSILEISSYHLRIEQKAISTPDVDLLALLTQESGVKDVTPFWETHILVSSKIGRMTPIKLRAIPEGTGTTDPSIASALGLAKDVFPGSGGIIIGTALADYLGVAEGDEIEASLVSSNSVDGLQICNRRMKVTRIFRSGYYDFDFGLGFMNLQDAKRIFYDGTVNEITYGIKLVNPNKDASVISDLRSKKIENVEGWRDYNRSFFGALQTEKTVMMILIGLIFIVVGVNIFQSMRRSVFNRTEEIALLRALGGSGRDIKRIFILDGLTIGIFGSIVGLLLGLLIAVNINEFFSLVSSVLGGISSLLSGIFGSKPEDFSIFSSSYFYLLEVPVRVLFPETFFIIAAAIGSAGGAAGIASILVEKLNPAELLRYE